MAYKLVPRTWRICENGDLNWCYMDICQRAIDEGIIDFVPQLYLFKSTSTWGWCRHYAGNTVIGLNEVYCQVPQAAINTIIHELGHAATPGHNHDNVWKKISNKLGDIYGQKIKRVSSEEERGLSLGREYVAKYIIECPNCHTQWKYQRMAKSVMHTEMYTCPYCSTKLTRVK